MNTYLICSVQRHVLLEFVAPIGHQFLAPIGILHLQLFRVRLELADEDDVSESNTRHSPAFSTFVRRRRDLRQSTTPRHKICILRH